MITDQNPQQANIRAAMDAAVAKNDNAPYTVNNGGAITATIATINGGNNAATRDATIESIVRYYVSGAAGVRQVTIAQVAGDAVQAENAAAYTDLLAVAGTFTSVLQEIRLIQRAAGPQYTLRDVDDNTVRFLNLLAVGAAPAFARNAAAAKAALLTRITASFTKIVDANDNRVYPRAQIAGPTAASIAHLLDAGFDAPTYAAGAEISPTMGLDFLTQWHAHPLNVAFTTGAGKTKAANAPHMKLLLDSVLAAELQPATTLLGHVKTQGNHAQPETVGIAGATALLAALQNGQATCTARLNALLLAVKKTPAAFNGLLATFRAIDTIAFGPGAQPHDNAQVDAFIGAITANLGAAVPAAANIRAHLANVATQRLRTVVLA